MAKKKKVMVTGAGGFIGSHLTEFLLKKNFDVYGTFYHPTVNLKEINPKVKLEKVDIRDKRGLLKILGKIKPTIIFHLAAQSYPAISWQKPIITILLQNLLCKLKY